MAFLYFVVVIIITLTSRDVAANFSKKKQNARNSYTYFDCPKPSGLYPHPSDCHKYYQCAHSVPHLSDCAKNLVFNEKIFQCDWLRNVPRCQVPPPRTFVCPRPKGQFRDPDDCTKFYNCWGKRAFSQDCPQGLYFNELKMECDYPENVPECNNALPEKSSSVVTQTVPVTSPIITTENTIKTFEEQKQEAIVRNIEWLRDQRDSDYSWGPNTPYALQSEQLANQSWFSATNLDSQISVRQFYIQLLSELAKDQDLKQVPIKELALAVATLTSTCTNPHNFYDFDMVALLEGKLVMLSKKLTSAQDHMNYALSIIALCQSNIRIKHAFIENLITTIEATTNSVFNIDVKSMSIIALSCISDQIIAFKDYNTFLPNGYKSLLQTATRDLLKYQSNDGSFNSVLSEKNIVQSTALASQALLLILGANWPMEKSIDFLIKSQESAGCFDEMETVYNVIPILNQLTILNGRTVACYQSPASPENENFECPKPNGLFRNMDNCSLYYNCWADRWIIQSCPSDTVFNPVTSRCDWPPTVADCKSEYFIHPKYGQTTNKDSETNENSNHLSTIITQEITTKSPATLRPDMGLIIKFTIVDTVYKSFNISKYFNVPKRMKLFNILEIIAKDDIRYKFEASDSTAGHIIRVVNNLHEDNVNNNYWFLYRAKQGEKSKLDDDGIDNIIPVNNEEFTLMFEKFVFE